MSGSLVVLVFVVQTIVAFFQSGSDSFGFWTWVAASETAAWRLKWISIPVLIAILVFGRKLYQSVRLHPEKFCGVKYARRGLLASSIVVLLIALLIGVTVPARLRHRQLAKEAAIRAQIYTFEHALLEYRLKYKSLPPDYQTLLERIPDPDGTLRNLNPKGYVPWADLAAVNTEKPRTERGMAIRNASISTATDDTPSGGIAFTNYVMRFPGEDKIMGTDDDWIGRDGVIMKLSEVAKGGVGRYVSAGALQP